MQQKLKKCIFNPMLSNNISMQKRMQSIKFEIFKLTKYKVIVIDFFINSMQKCMHLINFQIFILKKNIIKTKILFC